MACPRDPRRPTTRTTHRRSTRAASRANGRDTSPRHRSSRRDCSHDTRSRRLARRTARGRSTRPGCTVARRARRCGTSRSRPYRAGRPRADRPRSRTSALAARCAHCRALAYRALARRCSLAARPCPSRARRAGLAGTRLVSERLRRSTWQRLADRDRGVVLRDRRRAVRQCAARRRVLALVGACDLSSARTAAAAQPPPAGRAPSDSSFAFLRKRRGRREPVERSLRRFGLFDLLLELFGVVAREVDLRPERMPRSPSSTRRRPPGAIGARCVRRRGQLDAWTSVAMLGAATRLRACAWRGGRRRATGGRRIEGAQHEPVRGEHLAQRREQRAARGLLVRADPVRRGVDVRRPATAAS